jgi:hypothetical protein
MSNNNVVNCFALIFSYMFRLISLSNRNGLPMLQIDYDIDNQLIGKNLLLTIRTIFSNNDINIEAFKHYFFLNLMQFSLKINKKLSVTN